MRVPLETFQLQLQERPVRHRIAAVLSFASTSGSDADWVVKLIDVYPDHVKSDEKMAGYQLMVASEIMRGR